MSGIRSTSDVYCVPWGAIDRPPKQRKQSKPRRMSPGQKLLRMVERGRRPSLKQAKHELGLDDVEEVLQLVIATAGLEVRTREHRVTTRGKVIHVQDVVPESEPATCCCGGPMTKECEGCKQ